MKRILLFTSVLAGLLAGGTALAQTKDARTREYVTPVRVVWTQNDELISNADALLKEGNGQADFMERVHCDMKSTRRQHPAIILDFGREMHGGLQIVTGMGSTHDAHIRVRFGESVSEAMCEIDGKNGAGNDHAIRDQEIILPWFGVKEVGNSGFRFVRIDLIDNNTEISLKEVRAVALYRGEYHPVKREKHHYCPEYKQRPTEDAPKAQRLFDFSFFHGSLLSSARAFG